MLAYSPASCGGCLLTLPASDAEIILPTQLFPLGPWDLGDMAHLCGTAFIAPEGRRCLRSRLLQDSLLCAKLPGMGAVGRQNSPGGFPCPQSIKFSLLELLQSLELLKTQERGQIGVKGGEERSHVLSPFASHNYPLCSALFSWPKCSKNLSKGA